MLVVACNTVSAVALDALRLELDVPVIGVIHPGAQAGVAASKTGRLAVIATAGTVASGAYAAAVATVDTRAELISLPAPLLVPLAEEGWLEGDVPQQVVERYLSPLGDRGVDALILGCTHYPLFRPVIEEVGRKLISPDLKVADSAEATAAELKRVLEARGLALTNRTGELRVMVSDLPERFGTVAARFLGEPVEDVEAIDL